MITADRNCQMIEARQTSLTAEAFVVLGETYVGTAGNGCAAGSAEQMQNVRLAEGFVERGRESKQHDHTRALPADEIRSLCSARGHRRPAGLPCNESKARGG